MVNIHKSLTIIAHIVIIVGCGYTVAMAAKFFVYGPDSSPVAAAVPSQPVEGLVSVPIDQIAGWHLFGQPPANFQAVEQTEKLPETRLSLELVGVFVSDDVNASIALIAAKGRSAESFRVGDRVPGNAKLAAVFPNHVVISRGGVREQIRFEKRKEALTPVKKQQTEQTFEPAEPTPTPPSEAGPAPNGPSPVHEALTVLQDGLEKDPNRFLIDLGVKRVSDDNVRGYTIGALADHPGFSHVGLQRGDRILSINGRPVGDPEQDRLRIEDIIAEGSARLEIERGGQRLAVTVSIN